MLTNWFDTFIFIIIIISFIVGYTSGFIKQLASLAGIILGGMFAGEIASIMSPYLIDFTKTESYIIKPFSYIIAFICIVTFFFVLGRVVHKIFKVIQLSFLNRLVGAIFSATKWIIITSIIINIISTIDIKEVILKKETKENSKTYPYIKAITPYFIPFLDFERNNKEQVSK